MAGMVNHIADAGLALSPFHFGHPRIYLAICTLDYYSDDVPSGKDAGNV